MFKIHCFLSGVLVFWYFKCIVNCSMCTSTCRGFLSSTYFTWISSLYTSNTSDQISRCLVACRVWCPCWSPSTNIKTSFTIDQWKLTTSKLQQTQSVQTEYEENTNLVLYMLERISHRFWKLSVLWIPKRLLVLTSCFLLSSANPACSCLPSSATVENSCNLGVWLRSIPSETLWKSALSSVCLLNWLRHIDMSSVISCRLIPLSLDHWNFTIDTI